MCFPVPAIERKRVILRFCKIIGLVYYKMVLYFNAKEVPVLYEK